MTQLFLIIGKTSLKMIKTQSILFLVAILMSFTGFSQKYPRTIMLENDTCVAFTLNQSRKLIKWNEEKHEFHKLYDMCAKQIVFLDSVVTYKDTQILGMNKITENYKDIIKEKEQLMLLNESEKSSLKKEIKIQKRQKWLSIGIGALVSTVITIIAVR